MASSATFHFYGSLNIFLPKSKRNLPYTYLFTGTPSVKDAIEAIGVPHVEVDVIVSGLISLDFSYQLSDADQLLVYPKGQQIEGVQVIHLIEKFPGKPAFILDVHLGKLARLLRMLGFDTLYERTFADAQIAEIAATDTRIVLTRDVPLLKRKFIRCGYWLRSKQPDEQLIEVINYFDLTSEVQPFYRCLICNGQINKVNKSHIADLLEPQTHKYFHEFYQCAGCNKVYWKGSHYEKMKKFILQLHQAPEHPQ